MTSGAGTAVSGRGTHQRLRRGGRMKGGMEAETWQRRMPQKTRHHAPSRIHRGRARCGGCRRRDRGRAAPLPPAPYRGPRPALAAGSGTGKWSVLRGAPGLQLPEVTCGPAAVRGWQPPSGSAGPQSAPRPRAARPWCRRRSPTASPRGVRPAASLAARPRERPPLLLVLGMANSGLQLPPGISAVYVGLFTRGHGVWSWYAGF
ncbi:uncharacterized protein [Patagioenas fasciata]|uniref:uncharacterized protein n=1 Tax=Patagioenas fasciata TaxID=372321 RepID=UPI003A99B700